MRSKGLLVVALGALVFTAALDPFLEYFTAGQYRRAMLALAFSGLGLVVASWGAARLPIRIRFWGHGLAQLAALGILAVAAILLMQTLDVGQYRRAVASLGTCLVALAAVAFNTSRLSEEKRLTRGHLALTAALVVGLFVVAAIFSEYFFNGQFRRAILASAGVAGLLGASVVLLGSRLGKGAVWVPEAVYLAAILTCLGSVPVFWSFVSAGQFRRALLSMSIGCISAIAVAYWTLTVEPEGEWWGW